MNQHSPIPAINPNSAADPNAGIFGLPTTYAESKIIYLPIPWEATTSYGGGTAFGPEAILKASIQLDLFDRDVKDPYLAGLYALPISEKIKTLNKKAKKLAQTIKDVYGELNEDPTLKNNLKQVNEYSDELNQIVYLETLRIINDDKIPALIGGDHSVPFGAYQAIAEKFGNFGILHFDAHSDTREAYMGFKHSHASIMRNSANLIPEIKTIVQVGIRDFCEEEMAYTESQREHFQVFYDQEISEKKLSGVAFNEIANSIIKVLPEKVWVSFDIDGLDPRFCPHTGTPVPGGLDYSEALLILKLLAQSGRTILGFDVVEVAPPLLNQIPIEVSQAADEWDANVGMRLIYKLTALTLASRKLASWR